MNHLSRPAQIGSMRLRNRMIQPGMGTNLASADGTASDAIVDYYARHSQGGVGLIITEVVAPESRGRVIPGELEVSSVGFVPGLARIANAVHAGGAKAALQLAHGGCFASQSVTGEQPISPSGVGTALLPGDQPRAMTIEEIQALVETYGRAAQLARMAGFDAVEVHGAHGYLPLQFLSGYTNHRTDEYGGAFENRARFGLEVIRSIKRQAGADFPVIYRLSAEEDAPGGVTLAEAVRFAQLAQEAGADAMHISAGTWDSRIGGLFGALSGQVSPDGMRLSKGVSIGMWVPPHYVPRGNLIPLAETIKQAVRIPVIAVCGLNPSMAEEVIAAGKADLVSLGRQSLADPNYANKVMQGKADQVRPCVRCNECLGSVLSYRGIECTVNTETGKEHESFSALVPAKQPKRVMVIGGGPAGMEAARTARLRGHSVTLYEKHTELGGMLQYVSKPAYKKDYLDLLNWQKAELERLGVEVNLGATVTPSMVADAGPDAVILAIGVRQVRPEITGVDSSGLYGVFGILNGAVPDGQRVIIVGGGLAGTDAALMLAEQHGKTVTLIDPRPSIIPEVEIFTQWTVQGRLMEAGVQMRPNTAIQSVSQKMVEICSDGKTERLEADAVVIAVLKAGDNHLEDFMALPMPVIPVGDVVEPRRVLQAIHEGYHAGRLV